MALVTMEKQTNALSTSTALHLESNFYHMSNSLRDQFEQLVCGSLDSNGGMTPLTYTFCQDGYHFLSASSHDIFTPTLLGDLLDRLQRWGGETLGTSHTSTPQARVFVSGSRRNLLRDSVAARWHYILSLSHPHGKKLDEFTLLTETASKNDGKRSIGRSRIVSCGLRFNQLLVHSVSNPYGLKPTSSSMNPLDGALFLDGYFW
jgi:hypothetical protein